MPLASAEIRRKRRNILSSPMTVQNKETLKGIKILLNNRQQQRKELIDLLKQLADKLHIQHRQLNIAKTGFASGGVLAGIVSIVGFGLAPVTFGVSLTMVAVGGGISAVSGTGALLSFISEKIIIRILWEKVDKAIDEQAQTEKQISEVAKTLGRGIAQAAGVACSIGGVVAKDVQLKSGVSNAKTVVASLTNDGERFLHFGGFALTLGGMAIDIYTIVKNAKEIHKDSPCDAENQLRALIAMLEEENEDIGGI